MKTILQKKGQVSDVTTMVWGLVLSIMLLIFGVFAVLYGITTLNPGGFFTAGSLEQNATNDMSKNLTTGIGNFSGKIPTAFLVLGVVFALSFIVLLVYMVRRMWGGAGASL